MKEHQFSCPARLNIGNFCSCPQTPVAYSPSLLPKPIDLALAIKTCEEAGYTVEKRPLEKGEKYWFITDEIIVGSTSWNEYSWHKKRLEVGNCFKTRELAEAKLLEIKEILKK